MAGTPEQGGEKTERQGLTWRGVLLVPIVSLAWFILFTAGLCVDSSPYREALNGGASLGGILGTWFVVLTCYTPTNIALLAVLASVLGALGARATLQVPQQAAEGEPSAGVDRVNPYLSAVIRGFFVYLMLISGLLILIEDPFKAPTPEQYVRLAGFVSVFGFVSSYNPAVFGKIFEVIAQKLQTGPQGAGTSGPKK